MKKNRFLLLVLMLLASSLLYAGIIVRYENVGIVPFSSLEVIGESGISPPLFLKSGRTVEIKGKFYAQDASVSLTLKCHIIVNGVPLIVPCEERLGGITLPIREGNYYSCVMTINPQSMFGSCSGKLKLELIDDKGRTYVGALIECKIID